MFDVNCAVVIRRIAFSSPMAHIVVHNQITLIFITGCTKVETLCQAWYLLIFSTHNNHCIGHLREYLILNSFNNLFDFKKQKGVLKKRNVLLFLFLFWTISINTKKRTEWICFKNRTFICIYIYWFYKVYFIYSIRFSKNST